jgi:predicted permease
LSPVPDDVRSDVQADLHELFARRRSERGTLHAHCRLYHDIASLWLHPRPLAGGASPSTLALFGDAIGDLRYAFRLFARQPAVLLLTILGLSLGLGIATAAFSIMNAAVLRSEGLVDPDRAPGILRITDRSSSTAWTYDEFRHLRAGATRMQVEAVLAEAASVRTIPAHTETPPTSVAFVSGGFFAATGARMIAGRPLDAADEQRPGQPPVVVSYVYWTTTLNQDPAVVGRTIWIGRTAATIVGVAERGFSVPHNRLIWTPMTAYGAVYSAAPTRQTPDTGIQVFGRLLPDATLPEAEAQLSGVTATLPTSGADADSALRVRLDSHAGLGRVSASDAFATTVFVFVVIALVLLLACANVATVLIATAITRDREMGVRVALGASRSRIVRQLVTESLALGAMAALLGLVFAYWAIPAIGTLIEAPKGADLTPDIEVYLFLGIVTLLTGAGAGVAPAWHGRGTDLVTPLKGEGSRQNRASPRRLRSTLVGTQAAVSVLLIVMSALFVRATFRATTIDVGFDVGGLYEVTPGFGEAANIDGAAFRNFWARALSELDGVAGIGATTLVELTPFGNVTRTATPQDASHRVIYFNRARADYFAALGVRLLAGRTFTHEEVAARAPVALVSQSLARAYWNDRSPLGDMLPMQIPIPPAIAAGPGGPSLVSSPRPVVIGVVADAITERLHERSAFTVYEPLDPPNERFAQLLIRVTPGATGAIQEASQRLRAIDSEADVRIASIETRYQQEAGRPRMLATLTGFVGLIAIVLCVIGLYGLTTSVVGQRAREMGVRVAMGAKPRDLLRLLMWDSLRPVVLGLAIGAATAVLASRLLVATMFFGVSPQDPLAFAGAAAILIAAAMLAVLVPTRRAATVDAAVVLRQA